MKKIIAIAFFIGIFSTNAQEKIPATDTEKIMELAVESADKGDYETTLLHLNKIPKNDSTYISVLGSRVYYLFNSKKFEEAVVLSNEGIASKTKESKSTLYINKAVALINLKKHDDALKTIEEALKIYPKSYLLWYNKGVTLEALNELKKASEAYQRSITYNYNYRLPHLKLGNLCYKQGLYAQALMSFNMYVLLSPDASNATQVLNALDRTAAAKAPEKANPDIDYSGNDEQFESIDLVLNSLISLNGNYKTGNDINIALVKQNHALIEQLYEMEEQDDFWGKKYIPFYKWIKKEGQFNNFAYTLTYSIENEDFKKIIEKKTKDIKKFVEEFRSKWSDILKDNVVEFKGKKQPVSYNYVSTKLQAIGVLKDGKGFGPWEFYSEAGRLKSIGEFSEGEVNDGRWEWYHRDGTLKEFAYYQKGNLEGENKVYHDNGQLYIHANYKNNLLEGQYLQYNRFGALIQDKFFKKGNLDGTYKSYFIVGEEALEFLLEYKNDSIEGKGVEYYSNGKVYQEGFYKNGKVTLEKKYFINGVVSEEINYTNNVANGIYKSYHSNKQIAEIGQSLNGEYDGVWKTYYRNGTLQSEFSYKKGKVDGSYKFYDEDGILYYEFTYRKGEIIAYVFYDKSGALLKEGRKKGGEFLYEGLNPSGSIQSKGLYDISGGKKGPWSFYSDFGVLIEQGNFIEGEADGEYTTFFNDGTKKIISNYEKGSQEGYYVEYHKNGKIKKQGWVKNNQQYGEWKDYYIDGTIESIYFFHKGQSHGIQKGYSVEGKLVAENLYEFGKVSIETNYDNNGAVSYKNDHNSPKKKQVVRSFYSNGNKEFEMTLVNQVKQGPYTKYYFDGKKQSEGSYLNNQIHGKVVSYYNNGQIKNIGNYVTGSIDGEYLAYYEDGVLNEKEFYENGTLVGQNLNYHENGKLYNEIPFEYGEIHGKQKLYSFDGKLQLIRFYKYGKLIGYSYHDKSGEEVPMIPLKGGNGKIKAYYDNGKVSREMEYFNGELTKIYKEYYESGALESETNFVEGEYDKKHLTYHKNGQVKKEANYIHGNLHGAYKEYYENGQVKLIENYLNNEKTGNSKHFDKKGTITKEITYFNGDVINAKDY